MDSREWRDACRARLAARISVVDAYISIASSTSRRSNSALSVHPPHPTGCSLSGSDSFRSLIPLSLRSSPRRDRQCDVNAPGPGVNARAICDYSIYVSVCVTRAMRERRYRSADVVGWNFGLDKTRLRTFASKLARDSKYTDRFKFLGLRPGRVVSSAAAPQWISAFLEWRWCIPLFSISSR